MLKAELNTCGNCRFYGSCMPFHKSRDESSPKCVFFDAMPNNSQVPAMLDAIDKLPFWEQNQIRHFLNNNIGQLARRFFRVGMTVSFSIGTTRRPIKAKITDIADDLFTVEDSKGNVYKIFPGFISVSGSDSRSGERMDRKAAKEEAERMKEERRKEREKRKGDK